MDHLVDQLARSKAVFEGILDDVLELSKEREVDEAETAKMLELYHATKTESDSISLQLSGTQAYIARATRSSNLKRRLPADVKATSAAAGEKVTDENMKGEETNEGGNSGGANKKRRTTRNCTP